MCGIAGFSRREGGHTFPAGDLGLALALAIENRGPHATGFAWCDEREGWPFFWKAPGRASKVADQCEVTTHDDARTLLVHTRWATQGDPEQNENNHPVIAPGIVLVHNGHITNDDALFARLGVERTAEVDSEVVAALLAYGGEAPWKLLPELEGRAAIAWLDADEPEVLHLARVADSPIHYGRTKGGAFVFASTASALRGACGAARVSLDKVKAMPEGTYFRVERGKVTDVRRFAVPDHEPRWKRPVSLAGTTRPATVYDRDRWAGVRERAEEAERQARQTKHRVRRHRPTLGDIQSAIWDDLLGGD